MTVTKKMIFVMGGIGAYSLMKKKKGKQTANTAESPYGFPASEGDEIYLGKLVNSVHGVVPREHTTYTLQQAHPRTY